MAKYLDENFDEHEQLPRDLKVYFEHKKNKNVNVYVFNNLKQSIPIRTGEKDWDLNGDYYRFRLAFHFSYMTHLKWSPVIRDIMGIKRRSERVFEKAIDGPRQLIIEEGICSYIFSESKKYDNFYNYSTIPDYILKTVLRFSNYTEIANLKSDIWELSILEGFKIWKQLANNKGGLISLDLDNAKIKYLEV
ncbi:hypothetical protein IMCC3317_13140 [Kordia antarctica]|uniref:MazG C-terminal domain-containing protein n=1 Tax=Kordia antarctica TaxID=1218801 RepID=A0A7L4ZID9_9FLAO|nr:hypothetical protein [Kordia antarctica]QHI35966.1 hypothetical protein IMCC3317_13140 [Kordia antarctica]